VSQKRLKGIGRENDGDLSRIEKSRGGYKKLLLLKNTARLESGIVMDVIRRKDSEQEKSATQKRSNGV